MQICPDHYEKLKAAIEARGLTRLIAKDAQTSFDAAVREIQGEPAEPGDYDPLAACCWMIMGRALEMAGLYLMTGDLCPVCEAMKHTAHWPRNAQETEPAGEAWVEKHWIDGPADAALAHCQRNGLTSPPQ